MQGGWVGGTGWELRRRNRNTWGSACYTVMEVITVIDREGDHREDTGFLDAASQAEAQTVTSLALSMCAGC